MLEKYGFDLSDNAKEENKKEVTIAWNAVAHKTGMHEYNIEQAYAPHM